jgi:hypothetical protein
MNNVLVVRSSVALDKGDGVDAKAVPGREDDLMLLVAGPGDVLTVVGIDDHLDVPTAGGHLVRGGKAMIYGGVPLGICVEEFT